MVESSAMKAISPLLLLALLVCRGFAGETLINSDAWWDGARSHQVRFYDDGGTAIMDIDLLCPSNTTSTLRISGIHEIQAFNSAWRAAREKFGEWKEVAASNGISYLSRAMPISFQWTRVDRREEGKPSRRIWARDCGGESPGWSAIWFHANPRMQGGFCCGSAFIFGTDEEPDIQFGGIQVSDAFGFELLISATDPKHIEDGRKRLQKEGELFK